MKLEVTKIGDSAGLILPEELVDALNLGQSDWLNAVVEADGSILLLPRAPTPEKGMEIAEKAMTTDRNALSEVAK